MKNKIIRTICYFTTGSGEVAEKRLTEVGKVLEAGGYDIQTKRICSRDISVAELIKKTNDESMLLGAGELGFSKLKSELSEFYTDRNVSFNLDLTNDDITEEHIGILFDLIKDKPEKTFNFSYIFNNQLSSPFFPSAEMEKEGFSIGLQSTDLSDGCKTIGEWLVKTKEAWDEIHAMFEDNKDYLGIDSSVAPLFEGKSSLVDLVEATGQKFSQSVLTDTYMQITNFIKTQNPKPIGLCGLMFPCLEDFGLAREYEKGNFTLERNLFLSLHSGLGIDTYPIGIDEDHEKVINVLKTVQGLSNKYKKPLSIRFVSDGKAKIGDKTDFKNQYLKDVVVRSF